jgi:glycosyltransferase involved in cell wall biosynthesis
MKKLLIATDCFLPRWDGISRFLADIIPELNDFEITIVAPDFPGDHQPINAKIIRIPLGKLVIGDFRVTQNCKEAIEDHIIHSDIVWVHTLSTIGRTAVSLARKHGRKTIFFIHSIDWELVIRSINIPSPIKDVLYPFIRLNVLSYYKKCDLIMSPEENVERMLDWNGVDTKKVRVNMGVNLKRFTYPEDKELAKKAIGLSGQKVIGFCGRISREKNLDVLLNAHKRIRREYPDTVLLIVGSGIKKYEQKLKKEEKVFFVGSKDDVVPYLQAMDIFVLPSLVETTSLATLEAMACGAVPICTPVGYVREYIKEKVNGMLFPFGNETILALKIKLLLDNPHMIPSMSKAARLTVQQKFNFMQTAENVVRILKSVS